MPDWIESLLGNYGYLVVFLGVLLNNIGVPVPGDTLLLGAGWLCADGLLSMKWVIALGTLSCFWGGVLGYGVGRRVRLKILLRSRWFPLKPERIQWMDRFLKRHGARAVFFGRFVALVHPVTGLLAGMGRIPFWPFLFYNLAGSLAYALCYASAGYFFGGSWEVLQRWIGRAAYILAAMLVLAYLTFLLRKPLRFILNRTSEKHFKIKF